MRTLVPAFTAVLLTAVCVAPAYAEKWLWYPIRGGAVAYDADSRKTDAETGVTGADTLIFYENGRKLDADEFSFVAERLEFECRGQRHRWTNSAVLDAEGRIVRARPDSDWTPLPAELGSAALFQRMLCLSQTPPGGKEAPDLKTTLADMKKSNAGMAALASLAFPTPSPRVLEAPAPKAAPRPAASPVAPTPVAPPAVAPTPVAPAPDLIGSVIASAPALKTLPEPAGPPIATLDIAAVARAPEAVIPPPAGNTPYAVADRCLFMKEGTDQKTQFAFNDCAYRVNYAWCVDGSQDPRAECGGPTIARGAGTVSAKSNARSTYPGGLGRLHMFGCRAPGTPVVRTVDGRLTHQCLGPATTAQAQASAPKTQQKLPELRRLTP